MYLLVYYDVLPESDKKITVISLCFVVMTIFILHISDYLICLPLWLMQLISASKKYENNEKLVYIYENSILFKNEMIYFQLPGLHKFISFFEKSMGIEEAVKRINDLYWFTFQEKQAQKAIIKLGKDKETAHQYVHFLLIENNMPLVKTLSKVNRLAELYLLLFDKQEETQQDLLTTIKKRFFSQKKREGFPEAFNDRINFVCREMIKEEGHRFNHEITKTLGAAHKFLNAEHLEDFYEASSILEKLNSFPVEIKYFKDIQNLLPQIKKIKDTLFKIESIERYETRRLFLTEQKQIVEVLSTVTAKNFYEPFATIWKTSLEHVAKLLEQQADIYKDSASLRINLKNKNIYPSTQEQNFHFEINNKGQEFAFDISVEIETDSPALKFCGKTKIEIQVIESGTIKKISLPIIIDTPINTIIKGNITFSDRDREGKKVPFSFPITIVEQSSAFHVIENPYIAGLPIRHSFLYFGREDAYNFIDKNISSGDHAIVCHGLRRTGKSSLLYRIVNQGFTDKKLVPIYFDMQAIDDEKDFYYSLSDSIVQGMSLQSTSDVENFSNFKRFIKDLKTELSEKTVVLLIDEFEELQMRAEHGKMSKTVFSNIRHLMQHEEKLIFIFCGTHKLEEMSADYWSIFFNTAIYYKVSYLSPKDTEKLIREPVKEQLTYDNLAVEQIQKMTHGQPYLTQLMCRTIVNDLNENKQRNYATIDDVDDAAEIIITHGHDHFSSHIWQESNTLERLILSTAAEELTHKQLDNVGFDAIYDKIGAVTKTFSRKECMDTLGRLVSKDILTEKNLRYSFPVNLFRKWVFARHPLRQVRLGMPY
ncbi:MAG: AAA family ATPase [Desulfobacterales bacterium]|nr:AAA family ATPase [Desulfobacterales bacterium]